MNKFYLASNEAVINILDGEDIDTAVQRASIKYNQDEKYLRSAVVSTLNIHLGKGADSRL